MRLPLPNGEFAEFVAYNSPVVKNNPQLGSYRVTGPWGGGRVATSWKGMSAILRGPAGYFIIEPVEGTTDVYRISEYRDYMEELSITQGPLACGYDDSAQPDFTDFTVDPELLEQGAVAGAGGSLKAGNEARELRIYDLIMTNTGEFAQRVGGTAADVQAAFNTAVSTINGIFENEVGIRMNLVEVPGLIYLDPATDPFTNANQGSALLGQVIEAFEANSVPSESYDLGHIFTGGCTDVGGVVSGNACTGGKTRGVTCVGGSVVGAALRIMAHEVAHQFAVSHSWNNCPGSDNQRASSTAFEPGSGTTIMSYAGACGSENVGGEEPYYHVGSLEQFLRFTRETGARTCATVVETSNFTPQVILPYTSGFFIPANTPFRLVGSATDANGDDLTYNWEQYDLGPASEVRAPRGNAPIFRSYSPTPTGNERYFPRLDRIINNITTVAEKLPTYNRELTFRLTARDNNEEAGGVDWEEVQFFADTTAGPFLVNNPDSMVWRVGEYQRVSWDVANTDQSPVNCKRVDILLSTDGGLTFDLVLVENVANNGSAFITVPEAAADSDALIMVRAADNVFLNINQDAFRVEPATQPVFTFDPAIRFAEVCLPATVEVGLNTGSVLDFANPIALSVDETTLPAGAEVTFSSPTLTPGEDATLSLDLSDIRFNGTLELTVIAVAEGQDTARRLIVLDVTDNDYSDLATLAPVEGTTGIILSTDFSWTEAANADAYDIQVATSPTFSEASIVEQAIRITDTEYSPIDFFEPNTLYFWRIRPSNVCGDGAWTDPQSFRTVNSQCDTETFSGNPITLPGSGRAFVRQSTIFVETQGNISDINIPNVKVRYNFASNVTLTLQSPAGTRVVLYQENCFSTNVIDLGFDDDAPNALSCPPDDRRVFRPVGDLSAFNGQNTIGEWILEVAVSEVGGSAGAIETWSIQFCADVAASSPARINNQATQVPPLLKNSIETENLLVTSPGFNTAEIVYTLTALPTAGRLLLHRNELEVGDTFRQADIDGAGLFYENLDGTAINDDFGFLVTTPDGGYLAIDYHDIIIDENATVSTPNQSALDAGLEVFPNPVNNELQVRWTAETNQPLNLELYDVNGRVLLQQTVAGNSRAARLDTQALPAGIYLLRLEGAVRRIVKQ